MEWMGKRDQVKKRRREGTPRSLPPRRAALGGREGRPERTAPRGWHSQVGSAFLRSRAVLKQPSARDSAEQGHEGLLLSVPHRTPNTFLGMLFQIARGSVRSALWFEMLLALACFLLFLSQVWDLHWSRNALPARSCFLPPFIFYWYYPSTPQASCTSNSISASVSQGIQLTQC